MSTIVLEDRTIGIKANVEVSTGECKYCSWRVELKRRVEQDPTYAPHGGWGTRKRCIETKNYKNCSGFMPISIQSQTYSQ